MPDDRQDIENVAPPSGLIDTVADWLMTQALGETEIEDLLEGCCERLRSVGVPVWRAQLSFRILHPLYGGFSLTWWRGRGVDTEGFERAGDATPMFAQSPHYHQIQTGIHHLRRHLVGDEALLDFPILEDLRAEGGTDYFAYVVEFGEGRQDGIVGSWTTDRGSGFSEADIAALLRIQRRLAVACKMRIRTQVARNVMTTYLGPDAGLRVLDGQIARGDGDSIHAVIWYSDLRDFTRMTDSMPSEAYLAVLNNYFECTAGSVLDHGGDVLNFIGDAVLAIFPIRKGGLTRKRACQKALAAARDAQQRLSVVNQTRRADGQEPLAFGLGLHLGDVAFGNIGVPERLSFSVIGPTVNEVARLESLTKTLGRPVLVTGEIARSVPIEWDSLGQHKLRGIGHALEIFAPPSGGSAG